MDPHVVTDEMADSMNGTILIVDDDEDTAALLRDLLRRCGLDVTAVSSDDNVSSNCVAIRPTWS